jgi:choline dehydrogenase
MGMPILDDVNGPMVPGAGYINMNIAADGTRVSAVGAFLRPALSRPNLTLLLNTAVVKLNFKGTQCVGVKIMRGGTVTDIAAQKEVILAAGSINSPKLLMLSGVGEARALRSLGIDVVENLPGVGENLQDHVLVSGVVFILSSNNCRPLHPKRPRALVLLRRTRSRLRRLLCSQRAEAPSVWRATTFRMPP